MDTNSISKILYTGLHSKFPSRPGPRPLLLGLGQQFACMSFVREMRDLSQVSRILGTALEVENFPDISFPLHCPVEPT